MKSPARSAPPRIFLLSPAHCGGERAQLVFNEQARFNLAVRLRGREGATLAETFTFLSGLYFRGKIAYGLHFARPPAGIPGVLIITPNEGLRLHNERVDLERLRKFAHVDIARDDPRYHRPMLRDVRYGVSMARRGWLRKSEVLNTLGVEEFRREVRPS